MRAGRACRRCPSCALLHTYGTLEEGFPLPAPGPGTQPQHESRAYDCEIPASFPSILDATHLKESSELVVLCALKLCKKSTSAARFILLPLIAEVKAEKSRNSVDELCGD